jgi:hypothetical protein
MVKARIYVEGGGDSKEQRARCREGFRKLIENASFIKRSPAIVACGGRDKTYHRFKTATTVAGNDYPILLVDSEDPVKTTDEDPDSAAAWDHLKARDNWRQPASAANDQAQLMATCMETWIMADRDALSFIFKKCLQTSALLPLYNLEARTRDEVQDALHQATRTCGRDKTYEKGKRSFKILENLDPETLKKHLPHFRRFIATLDRHLKK